MAVVDAKYKRYAIGQEDGVPERKLTSEDLYQLAFYGAALGADTELIVVSPIDEDSPDLAERYRQVLVADRAIRIVGVDLQEMVRSKILSLPLRETNGLQIAGLLSRWSMLSSTVMIGGGV